MNTSEILGKFDPGKIEEFAAFDKLVERYENARDQLVVTELSPPGTILDMADEVFGAIMAAADEMGEDSGIVVSPTILVMMRSAADRLVRIGVAGSGLGQATLVSGHPLHIDSYATADVPVTIFAQDWATIDDADNIHFDPSRARTLLAKMSDATFI